VLSVLSRVKLCGFCFCVATTRSIGTYVVLSLCSSHRECVVGFTGKVELGAHVVYGVAWAGWAQCARDRARVSQITLIQDIKGKIVLHSGC
jgi:hypothetical protein